MAKDDRIIGILEERSQATLRAIDNLQDAFESFAQKRHDEHSKLMNRVSSLEKFKIQLVAYTTAVATIISGIFKLLVS